MVWSEEGNDLPASVSRLADALREYQTTAANEESTAAAFSWAADILASKAKTASLSPKKASDIYFALWPRIRSLQNFDVAARLLEQALPALSGEQRLTCLLRRGAALTKTGNTKEAVKALDQAAAGARGSMEARYALAQALVRDGQKDRARQEYQRILTSFDLSPEGRRTVQQEVGRTQRLGGKRGPYGVAINLCYPSHIGMVGRPRRLIARSGLHRT